MHITTSSSLRGIRSDALVLGFFDHERPVDHPLYRSFSAPVQAALKTWLGKKDVSLEWGACHVLHLAQVQQATVIFGLGKKSAWTRRRQRLVARRISRLAHQHRWLSVVVPMHDLDAVTAAAITENLLLADYDFLAFRKAPKNGWPKLKTVTLVTKERASKEVTAAIKKAVIIGEATNMIRDFANTPGGTMTPTLLAQEAQTVAKKYGLKYTVFTKAQMEKLGMNAVLGVAKGSDEEPKFIMLEYRGGQPKDAPIAFVGKGVTFDSGGLNLKPGNSMQEMHMDMAGGAATIGAIAAIAQLKLPINVVAVIPAVENMVSGSGFRPGDLLKSLSGKVIQIDNTDAEGRVILADALTYTLKEFKPKLTVDVATLTGAALVALGFEATALFTKQDTLREVGSDIGEASGDYVWPLPMWEEYAPMVKAQFGDVTNSGKIRWGGAIEGAMFLAEFTEGKPWIHLDIAPTMSSAEGQYLAPGATGSGVRWLVELASRVASGTLKI